MFMTESPNNEDPDESALVRSVQAGEASAFAPLLDRHLEHIHAFIAVRLPVPHLVDEIAHETFVFAFRNLARFTPGTSLRAWLRAIAANKIRAELERFGREQRNRLGYSLQREIELSAAEPDERTHAEIRFLEECIALVPDHLRALLDLKYRDGRSSDAIAFRLQRSAAWVRTTLFRVRQQLRECLESKLGATQP